jgi:tRNA-specific 2-thiouridylase
MPITDRLNIPLKIYDGTERFNAKVVDYFIDAYRAGQTPNPCLVCNPVIKFGDLMRFSHARGADLLATGHYARILPAAGGGVRLFRGKDPGKDQSYFLARLSRGQLASSLFPLGEMTKTEVVALARKNNLVPIVAGESQDICFIKNGDYGEFMARQPGFQPHSGSIVNTAGKEIGQHRGLHLFTIGQRRGINCPAEAPYYVVRIEPDDNRLVVGRREDLLTSSCRVVEINWIAEVPTTPMPVTVKIRYRHRAVPAMVFPLNNRSAQVRFDQAQAAVTPGQGAVFYRGDEVMGGGWIVREGKAKPVM